MAKKKLMKGVIIIALVLLVPFLIGRITVAILEITYPRPASPSVVDNRRPENIIRRMESMREEAQAAIRSLERARAITRIALVVIGVYYLVLISGWVILRRQKRKSLRS